MSVVVQGNSKTPPELQERIEAWLSTFRTELISMDPEEMADEAAAVAAQLTEKDTKLSHSVGRMWGEISNRECSGMPIKWDRYECIAGVLKGKIEDGTLKETILGAWDDWFEGDDRRRAMSAWIWGSGRTADFEKWKGERGVLSSSDEVYNLKQRLPSFPNGGLK